MRLENSDSEPLLNYPFKAKNPPENEDGFLINIMKYISSHVRIFLFFYIASIVFEDFNREGAREGFGLHHVFFLWRVIVAVKGGPLILMFMKSDHSCTEYECVFFRAITLSRIHGVTVNPLSNLKY